MDSTMRYLGVELEDELAISEAIEVWTSGPFNMKGPELQLIDLIHTALQLH